MNASFQSRSMVILALFAAVATASADGPTPSVTSRGADAPTQIPARLYSRVQVLCVGINRYKSRSVPPLSWAENDATALADLFRNHFGYRVDLLLGRDATKASILEKLQEYQDGRKNEGGELVEAPLGDDDALLIFFAGHGYTVEQEGFGRKGYLIPYDASLNPGKPRVPDEWASKAIDMEELGLRVRTLKARHVFVMADACYSGYLGKRSGLENRIDLQVLAMRKSRLVMTAGSENEEALERADLKHGLFSYSLLKQLEVPDALSAQEVFVGVRDEVARESNGSMLPLLREFVVDNGEFVFVPKAIKDQEVQTALNLVNQRLNEVAAAATQVADVCLATEAYDYRYSTRAVELAKEWEQRFSRFQDNATLGDAQAMAGLYYCYRKGLGADADSTKAYEWALRAYETDQPIGLHVLGDAHFAGCGTPKNELQGRKLIQRAAELGCAISQHQIARWLIAEDASDTEGKNRELLAKYLESAASAGVFGARIDLGKVLIQGGLGIPREPQRGWNMLNETAKAGIADAWYALSSYLADGIPDVVAQNFPERHACLLKAADVGHPAAQLMIAKLHMGWFPDEKFVATISEARRWADLALAQGKPQAALLLGIMYSDGLGVVRDDQQAVKYYQQAADGGDGDATYLLATWHWDGRAVTQDQQKAAQLGERAGRLGHPDGWWVAGMYELVLAEKKANRFGLDYFHLRRAADMWLRAFAAGSERALPALMSGPLMNGVEPKEVELARLGQLLGPEEPEAHIIPEINDWRVILKEEKAKVGQDQREELIASGQGERTFSGMALVDSTARRWLGQRLGLDAPCVVVTLVYPDAPANKAGVREFDILTKVNGQLVRSSAEAINLIRGLKPGQNSSITIRRVLGDKPEDLELQLVPEHVNSKLSVDH